MRILQVRNSLFQIGEITRWPFDPKNNPMFFELERNDKFSRNHTTYKIYKNLYTWKFIFLNIFLWIKTPIIIHLRRLNKNRCFGNVFEWNFSQFVNKFDSSTDISSDKLNFAWTLYIRDWSKTKSSIIMWICPAINPDDWMLG